MEEKRYISLLLITCFSVFLGHNLIPHHHHAEAINIAMDDHCSIDHEDHNDSGDHPLHCHAFNGVDFVKYNHSALLQPVRTATTFVVPDPNIQLEPYSALEFRWNISLKIPDKSTESIGANSLRAPPVSI